MQWRFLGPGGPTVLSTLSGGGFDACLMAPFPLLHTHGGVVRPNIPIVEEQDLIGCRCLAVGRLALHKWKLFFFNI